MSARDEATRMLAIGLIVVVTAGLILGGLSLAGSLSDGLPISGASGEVEVAEGSQYLASDGQVVVGEVTNGLDTAIGDVVVTVTRHEDGEPVDTVTDAPLIDPIPGDTTVPFEVRLPWDGAPEDYTIEVSYEALESDVDHGLTLVESWEQDVSPHSVNIAGTVAYEGDDAADRPRAVVTFYDEDGTVIGARFDRVEPDPLEPDVLGEFDVRFSTVRHKPSLALEYDHYAIVFHEFE